MNQTESLRLEKGREITQRLLSELRSTTFREVYPTLFNAGVPEGSLHSYMLSILLLLGDRLGYSAVSDSPVFDTLDNLLIGEGKKTS